MTENFLKNRIDERHYGGALGHDDHGANEQQEGNKQGNIDIFCGLYIAPEVLKCVE